jgi:hypothetical protein
VVVAVIAVLIMDVALHEKIDVARVWHGLVPAGGIVTMGWTVSVTIVPARTVRRISAGGDELVFVDVTLVCVMQVTVVQEVGMIFMLHFRMPAVIAVLMLVGVVRHVGCHGEPPICDSGIEPRDTAFRTSCLENALVSRPYASMRLPRRVTLQSVRKCSPGSARATRSLGKSRSGTAKFEETQSLIAIRLLIKSDRERFRRPLRPEPHAHIKFATRSEVITLRVEKRYVVTVV